MLNAFNEKICVLPAISIRVFFGAMSVWLLTLSGPTFSVVRQAGGGGRGLRSPDAKNQS